MAQQMQPLLDDPKLSASKIARVELNRLEYRQDFLEVYAEVLGCSVMDLLFRAPTDPQLLMQAIVDLARAIETDVKNSQTRFAAARALMALVRGTNNRGKT